MSVSSTCLQFTIECQKIKNLGILVTGGFSFSCISPERFTLECSPWRWAKLTLAVSKSGVKEGKESALMCMCVGTRARTREHTHVTGKGHLAPISLSLLKMLWFPRLSNLFYEANKVSEWLYKAVGQSDVYF